LSDGHAVDVTDWRSAHSFNRHSTRRCNTQIAVVSSLGIAAFGAAKKKISSVGAARPSSVESTCTTPLYASAATALLPWTPNTS